MSKRVIIIIIPKLFILPKNKHSIICCQGEHSQCTFQFVRNGFSQTRRRYHVSP